MSQWRGYGAFGGCALEFDESEVDALIAKEERQYRYATAFLDDVKYNDHSVAFEQNAIDGVAAAFFRNMVEQTLKSKDAYEERSSNLFRIIAGIAPTLKSQSFSEEQEVRIVASHMRRRMGTLDKRREREISMRFKNGSPVPYLKLFEGFGKLPIKRLIVGPQRDQKKTVYALELVLEACGIKAEITCSDISYLP